MLSIEKRYDHNRDLKWLFSIFFGLTGVLLISITEHVPTGLSKGKLCYTKAPAFVLFYSLFTLNSFLSSKSLSIIIMGNLNNDQGVLVSGTHHTHVQISSSRGSFLPARLMVAAAAAAVVVTTLRQWPLKDHTETPQGDHQLSNVAGCKHVGTNSSYQQEHRGDVLVFWDSLQHRSAQPGAHEYPYIWPTLLTPGISVKGQCPVPAWAWWVVVTLLEYGNLVFFLAW